MRPPAQSQNPVKTPLNDILGSEGNVRVLRILTAGKAAVGRADVARMARLNPSGVRRILDRLADLGLVEIVGSGKNQAVSLRDRHPMAESLRSLFSAETDVYNRIVTTARAVISDQSPFPQAVWIENSINSSPGTVDIGVLGSPENIDRLVASIEQQFRTIENRLATHFVVHGYADADLLVNALKQFDRLEDITLLSGWIPIQWRMNGGGPIRTHRDLDKRARMIGEIIADQLPSNYSLIERAIEWIDHRLQPAGDRDYSDLREWRQILTELSVRQIQAFLKEDSERATRLRQSLPFVDAMTKKGMLPIDEEIRKDYILWIEATSESSNRSIPDKRPL